MHMTSSLCVVKFCKQWESWSFFLQDRLLFPDTGYSEVETYANHYL